jgi:hypothetical protein
MACRLLLLLSIMTVVLSAEMAGGNFGHSGSVAGLELEELRSADVSPGSQPALKRGGVVLIAVESSRRKARVPQRPQGQPLILTSRFIADGELAAHPCPSPSSEPALKAVQPARPFLDRCPPAWNVA